jgi:hypothetical protein
MQGIKACNLSLPYTKLTVFLKPNTLPNTRPTLVSTLGSKPTVGQYGPSPSSDTNYIIFGKFEILGNYFFKERIFWKGK